MTETNLFQEAVNLEKYPLDSADSSKLDVAIKEARDQITRYGYAYFPDFLQPTAMNRSISDTLQVLDNTHRQEQLLKAHVGDTDKSELKEFEFKCRCGYIAGDDLANHKLIKALYRSTEFISFVSQCLDRGKLFCLNDPLASYSIAVMNEGDYIDWHLDSTDFVAYLVLKDCTEGGVHEIIDVLNSNSQYDAERIFEVIKSDVQNSSTLPLNAGALVIFDGKRLLHRVTKVRGASEKIITLLFYSFKDGDKTSDELRQARFGRTS